MALKVKNSDNTSFNEMNVINVGTSLEGTIETKGSLRIYGKVKGVVRVGDQLMVGEKGEVSGEVYAKNAVIGGRIEGDVHVEQKLVLEAKSSLVGNVSTTKLVIDEGAFFNGKSAMGGNAATGTNGKKGMFEKPSQSESHSGDHIKQAQNG